MAAGVAQETQRDALGGFIMKHQVNITIRVRRLHSPEVVARFFPPVIVDEANEEAVLAAFAHDLDLFDRYESDKEGYVPPERDPQEAVRHFSDRMIEVVEMRASPQVAIMAALDASLRLVKASNGVDNIEAIKTLEDTLRQIREAEENAKKPSD
jgi:hypothetical protein